MQKITVKIEKNIKIKDFLLNYGFSNSQANKIIKNKDVKIDGKRLQENENLLTGQSIVIFCEELPGPKFKIIYEDENVVVVSKSQNIEVQGKNSLEELIPGTIAVHRLDRNTSGLLIMAKNLQAEKSLKEAFKNQTVEKLYVCEVYGKPQFRGKTYEAFLLKDAMRSQVKVFSNYVQNAVKIKTAFKTIKIGEETSLVVAKLFTGKTHQIRAHLAFLGYPIIGDGKYGNNQINKKFKLNYQKLHCFSLKIEKIDKNLDYLINKVFFDKPEWAKKYL